MSRRSTPARAARGRRRRLAILSVAAGLVAIAALTVAAVWRGSGEVPGTGVPRLVVDRTHIDLGYLRFETPGRATFVLTNAGDGPLRIEPSLPVRAVLGC